MQKIVHNFLRKKINIRKSVCFAFDLIPISCSYSQTFNNNIACLKLDFAKAINSYSKMSLALFLTRV